MSVVLERAGRTGVFLGGGSLEPQRLVELAGRIEEWGYGTLWLPEAVGCEPFVQLGLLAGRTEKLVLATGIANIYARDAMTMQAARKTMAAAASGRFVLGLGVSSPKLVSDLRGHDYQKPVPAMRSYLKAMQGALYRGPQPEIEAPVVLGALGPLMLRLAREESAGAIPFLVPPEHTARAREILGPDSWLCTEQMLLLEDDPARAREVGRRRIRGYLTAPGYRSNLERLGFSVEEIDAASDRLVDAVVAWGDVSALEARVRAHFDAGADQVCIQALRTDDAAGPDERILEHFAPRSGAAREPLATRRKSS